VLLDTGHIPRPVSSMCGSRTLLMRIMARSAGMEVRMFECPSADIWRSKSQNQCRTQIAAPNRWTGPTTASRIAYAAATAPVLRLPSWFHEAAWAERQHSGFRCWRVSPKNIS